MDPLPLLSLVVPFYNEEEMIRPFFDRVIPELERIPGIRFEVVCVNDGSRDRTLDQLVVISRRDARGDLIVPFDADLQDPPDVIARLVDKWREGYDVVLARRVDRQIGRIYLESKGRPIYLVRQRFEGTTPHA
jgi:glycosyltransferase involved in cell wall biosynthesis